MKILIIGSGGREYSIALALKKDPKVSKILFAPGNGATSSLGQNIDIKNYDELANFAKDENIDLIIVGPEAPLVDGVVDIFEKEGLNIFGPSREASQLEGSKVFMKEFLKNNSIKTASFISTSNLNEASKFIDSLNTPIVVKADGLCAGKGVIIAKTHQEAKDEARKMLFGESFGEAGSRVVIEEFLDGFELSLFALCDGENYILLPAAQDHKRLLDLDKGPNTGGMGAYAPTPLATKEIYERAKKEVIEPTLKGMQSIGAPFKGVLFVGLMIVKDEIYVLEYNVRFGDPECEVLMPLLDMGASEIFYKAATNDLKNIDLKLNSKVAVGVVIASKDYPYKNSVKEKISIDFESIKNGHLVFAGVEGSLEEGLIASGGRVLVAVGLGDSVKEAQKNAYEVCKSVNFNGMQYRKDIAYQAANR